MTFIDLRCNDVCQLMFKSFIIKKRIISQKHNQDQKNQACKAKRWINRVLSVSVHEK